MKSLARYTVGVLVVAAGFAVSKNWHLIRPQPEEPAPYSGGGILDMHEDSIRQSIEFMERQQNTPPPPLTK